MENKRSWIVNVPVANIWTSYHSPREIDLEITKANADIQSWLDQLDFDTRIELCHRNLLQTQALFGEEVIIDEEKGDWVRVVVIQQPSSKDERGYPGWMPKTQLVECENWNLVDRAVAVISSKKAKLYTEDQHIQMELSYGTILPLIEAMDEWIKVRTPLGICLLKVADVKIAASLSQMRKGSGHDIVASGEQFIGLPYLWGGMSSFGFDCSGFSYRICSMNGYMIPRDAHDQASAGYKVAISDIEPGDLLFFAFEEGKGAIHHVGIYYGDGKMLHSPNTGKTIETITLAGTIYEKELCGATRYWQDTEES